MKEGFLEIKRKEFSLKTPLQIQTPESEVPLVSLKKVDFDEIIIFRYFFLILTSVVIHSAICRSKEKQN